MKHLFFYVVILLLLTGCSLNIGFGISGAAAGSNGGTEVIATQDGIHGRVVAAGDFVN